MILEKSSHKSKQKILDVDEFKFPMELDDCLICHGVSGS